MAASTTPGDTAPTSEGSGSADSLVQLGHHPSKYTAGEHDAVGGLVEAFEGSGLSVAQRLQAFPRFVRRQDLARFLVRYEIFKRTVSVTGSVVECGVFGGGGIQAWAQFSSMLEPYNHSRRVIGFDTFTGFPSVHDKDVERSASPAEAGDFHISGGVAEEIARTAALHDGNRPLGHIPKVELVRGDAIETIPQYLDAHRHLLVSLLYLDFDLYEPTRVALEQLYPRVVGGGVVAFDELNCPDFPGETMALLEALGMPAARLERSSVDPYISYFVKG